MPPPAPPAALTTALQHQRSLQDGYDRLSAANPSGPAYLAGLRSDVHAHGDALRALLERYPGWRLSQAAGTAQPSPSSPAAPSSLAALASASRSTSAALTSACRGWPAGEPNAAQVLPVLGSIAAALSTHALVLAQP
ncbi:MAG: hypothetical protein ABI418_17480 [Jatrophihabitantaceae bacterium]